MPASPSRLVRGTALRETLLHRRYRRYCRTSQRGVEKRVAAGNLRHVPAPASDSPAPRGRRPARPSGDDRELAILATAERLLAERPLSAISVDDLARGAGISRPTFYFYFASKDAVLLTLLDRVVAEADAATRRRVRRPAGGPAGGMAAGDHRLPRHLPGPPVADAGLGGGALDQRRDPASCGRRCSRAGCTAARRRSRPSGSAARPPPGRPARDIAVALTSMNERVLYATFTGDGPGGGRGRRGRRPAGDLAAGDLRNGTGRLRRRTGSVRRPSRSRAPGGARCGRRSPGTGRGARAGR